MSDIRFNQWLHQSGTGGITQVDEGHVGIGTTNPDVAVHSGNTKKINVGIVTANSIYAGNSNISGVTTATNFKTGSSNLHSAGVEIAGVNVLGGDTPIGAGATIYNSGAAVFTGVVTATQFKGDGSQLTGITGTTINNNADNRVITGSGTANTLNGESELTYNGSGLLSMVSTGSNSKIKFQRTGTSIGGHIQTRDESNDKGLTYVAQDGNSAKAGHVFITDQTSDGSSPQERLRIADDGNVSIGGIDPVATSSAYDKASLHIHQTNSGSNKGSQIHLSSAHTGSAAGDGSNISVYSTSLYINNQENGDTHFYNNGSPTATIKADGSFGIATQAPTEKLHVNGTTKLGGRVSVTTTSSPLTSANSSANDLVVSGDGAMGVTLHTNSTNQNCNIYFSDTGSAYSGAIQYRHNHDQLRLFVNNNYSYPAMQFNSNLSINFNGTMYSNGNAYSTASDLNMKSNLVRFTNTVDKLKQITGYAFDIKCGGGDKTRKSGGVIAQDVEKVYPDFVDENPETGMKSLEYNTLIGVLVEAVKELTTKVETLESKVDALEG